MKTVYNIKGMTCEGCVERIRKGLEGTVKDFEVTLNPPRLHLKDDNLPNMDALNKALEKAGHYTLDPNTENRTDLTQMLSQKEEGEKTWITTYYPLFLIVGAISVVSFRGTVSINDWMLNFMAGFFLVFGFFKLLDLKGFRDAYSTYDLLAKKWNNYGLVYPFLELALGLAFLFRFQLIFALWFSIILMGFSSLGVIKALSEKRKIRCACLGTALNLPMSTITLVEDLGMVLMSAVMLTMI